MDKYITQSHKNGRSETGTRKSVADDLPLSSSIHWYLNMWKPLNPHYRNIIVLFKVEEALHPTLVHKTVQYLIARHDTLRSRFFQDSSGWCHVILDREELDIVTWVDLSAFSQIEQKTCIEACAAQLQTSLHLSEGPLIRIVYFDLGTQNPGRLLTITHHLISDGMSQFSLIKDFVRVYTQLKLGKAIHLPPIKNSYKRWVERLNEYANSSELQQDLAYWLAQPWDQVVPISVDYPSAQDNGPFSSLKEVKISLNVEETARLQKTLRTIRTQMIEALLAAVAWAFYHYTGSPLLHIGVSYHGRTIFNDLNVLQTVGFMALCRDILLDTRASHTAQEALVAIKKQYTQIPHQGLGLELLSRLNTNPLISEKLKHIPRRQIVLNYLGISGVEDSRHSLLKRASEYTGSTVDLQDTRLEMLYCTAAIHQNQLFFSIEYGELLHKRETIERLATYVVSALREMIEYTVQSDGSEF